MLVYRSVLIGGFQVGGSEPTLGSSFLRSPRILGSMAFNFSMGVTEGPEARQKKTAGVRKGWGEVDFLGTNTVRSTRPVVSNIFYFHPYLGKIPILTNIFQMG